MFLFMVINFADKAVVGLAAKPMMQDLRLTPEQFGLLGSAFFLLFPLSAVLVGFLSNRRPANRMLLAMAILWSAIQFPMLASASFSLLLVNRILLGVAEGPAYPVALHAVYKWFPDSLRALPTAVIAQGASFGVIVAVPALNGVIVHYSWHWAFGALGLAGLAWSAAWALWGREGALVDAPPMETRAEAAAGGSRLPYRRLLLSPTVLAIASVGLAAYWGLALVLTWLTSYMVDGLGFSQTLGGDLSVLPWVAGAVVVLAGGWFSQRLKTAGFSSRVSRGVLPGLAILLGGVLLLGIGAAGSSGLKVVVVVIGTALGGIVFVAAPIVVSELSPQPQRAAMLAIVNSVMTLGAVVAPLAMGVVLQGAPSKLSGYDRGFFLLGLLQIAGGAVALLLVRPERDRARLWPVPSNASRVR